MNHFSIKHLKLNEYTLNYEEVSEGNLYGFWRIIEHTDAGWFPWYEIYTDKAIAQAKVDKLNEDWDK